MVFVLAILLDGEVLVSTPAQPHPAQPPAPAPTVLARSSTQRSATTSPGSIFVAVLDGAVVLVLGLVLGVPLAPIAAIWAMVTNLIPQIGGFLGGSFFVLLAFSASPTTGLLALVLFVAYLQIENNIIQPAIVGQSMNLSPPTTMIAALIGGAVAGVPGALAVTPARRHGQGDLQGGTGRADADDQDRGFGCRSTCPSGGRKPRLRRPDPMPIPTAEARAGRERLPARPDGYRLAGPKVLQRGASITSRSCDPAPALGHKESRRARRCVRRPAEPSWPAARLLRRHAAGQRIDRELAAASLVEGACRVPGRASGPELPPPLQQLSHAGMLHPPGDHAASPRGNFCHRQVTPCCRDPAVHAVGRRVVARLVEHRWQCRYGAAMAETTIELAEDATPEVVEAMTRLLPQLSSSAPPPTVAEISDIVASPATLLLLARVDGRIVGSLTVALFRLPSGMRAWIEDVVVDLDARGHGVGEALNKAALDEAKARGARTVDLTSRPSREAANRLYQRLGFVARETNVYRFTLDA